MAPVPEYEIESLSGRLLRGLKTAMPGWRNSYVIAECMIRKLFEGWLLFLLLIGLLALGVVLFQSGPEELTEVLTKCRDNGITVTFWTTMLLLVIAGSMELPREIQSGTIMLLLAKPIERRDVVLGKLVGLLTVGYLCVMLQTAVSIGVIAMRGMGPDYRFFVQCLLVFSRVTILGTSVILFSTALPEFPTIFISAMYLGLGSLMYLLDALIVSGYLNWFFRGMFRFTYYFAPNFMLLTVSGLGGKNPPLDFVIYTVGYTISYCSLLTWLALFTFNRREFGRL